jgi:hypothetical protein
MAMEPEQVSSRTIELLLDYCRITFNGVHIRRRPGEIMLHELVAIQIQLSRVGWMFLFRAGKVLSEVIGVRSGQADTIYPQVYPHVGQFLT